MDEGPRKIIVKNVKKHYGGHHGGNWKVAYADFVTAMMAFFLLMWLLNMVSPEKRAVLALYFKDFSLFEKGGTSFMMEGGPKITDMQAIDPSAHETEGKASGLTPEELRGLLMEQINQKLEPLKDQIIVDISKNGIRVQVVDKENSPIFPPGSTQLTEQGRSILQVIGDTTRGLPNKVALEGHTDSSPSRGELSNWELSAARACTARRELEQDGIASNRMARVVGFADTAPLIEDNLQDPRNRRVSIIFLYERMPRPAGSQGTSIYDLLEPRY